MQLVTEELLIEYGFTLQGNKWVHEKGTFIYSNNLPENMVDVVKILTGTAYKKGKENCHEL